MISCISSLISKAVNCYRGVSTNVSDILNFIFKFVKIQRSVSIYTEVNTSFPVSKSRIEKQL